MGLVILKIKKACQCSKQNIVADRQKDASLASFSSSIMYSHNGFVARISPQNPIFPMSNYVLVRRSCSHFAEQRTLSNESTDKWKWIIDERLNVFPKWFCSILRGGWTHKKGIFKLCSSRIFSHICPRKWSWTSAILCSQARYTVTFRQETCPLLAPESLGYRPWLRKPLWQNWTRNQNAQSHRHPAHQKHLQSCVKIQNFILKESSEGSWTSCVLGLIMFDSISEK